MAMTPEHYRELQDHIRELQEQNRELAKEAKELRRLLTEAHGRLAQRRTARADYIEQISALFFAAYLVRPGDMMTYEMSQNAINRAADHARALDKYFERPSA